MVLSSLPGLEEVIRAARFRAENFALRVDALRMTQRSGDAAFTARLTQMAGHEIRGLQEMLAQMRLAVETAEQSVDIAMRQIRLTAGMESHPLAGRCYEDISAETCAREEDAPTVNDKNDGKNDDGDNAGDDLASAEDSGDDDDGEGGAGGAAAAVPQSAGLNEESPMPREYPVDTSDMPEEIFVLNDYR